MELRNNSYILVLVRNITRMKYYTLFSISCIFLWLSCAEVQKQELIEAEITDRTILSQISAIDSLVRQLVQDSATAGIGLGIQVGNNKPYIASYGLTDIEQQLSVNDTTLFSIASITKPFTATGIAFLIDQGKIALDDSLHRFFPDYPKGNEVTLYQLLSHTSGIPDWWIGGLPEDVEGSWTRGPNPHYYLQRMERPYIFEPGTYFSYSNSAYLLLGEIIEKVSNESYHIFLQKNIFQANQLTNTLLQEEEGPLQNSAKGYVKEERRFVERPFFAGDLKAVGGLKTNVSDLLHFSRLLFDGEIISSTLLEQMTSYAKTNSGKLVYEAAFTPEGFTPPELPAHLKKNGYGLGFSLMENHGKPVIWHSGGMPGFNSILAYYPESNTIIALLSNTENGIIPQYEQIMKIGTEINYKK